MKPVVLVIGDSLLDRDHRGISVRLAPDAPVPVIEQTTTVARPGGAALTAMILLSLDVQAELVSAFADDLDGLELTQSLEESGVRVHGLRGSGQTRTKERVLAGDQVIARLDRGSSVVTPLDVDREKITSLMAAADAILVSDYAGGVLSDPAVSAALRRTTTPIIWDPHPRGSVPVPGCRLVTPNEPEARAFSGDDDPATMLQIADHLRQAWLADSVAVTLGSRGAAMVSSGSALFAPARPVVGDSCGAGDAFAAAAASAIARGETVESAVTSAVAFAAAWVGRAAATSLRRTRAAVRATGGQVVATGGCFDLLHRGHLATLAAAKSLGDYLVVCINSDASIRAIKGPSRPFVAAEDRKALLEALEFVDEVVIFDESNPIRAIEQIKPDIWVKGGDYLPEDLPERETLARWGGQVVIVPYLPGHSTTSLAASIGHVIDLRSHHQEIS